MDTSPLGRLPPELRNIIYDLTLRFEPYLRNQIEKDGPRPSSEHHANPLALTMACKQVRQETLALAYGGNILLLDVGLFGQLREADEEKREKHFCGLLRGHGYMLQGWLRSIGDSTMHLHNVCIGLGLSSCFDKRLSSGDLAKSIAKYEEVFLGTKVKLVFLIVIEWTWHRDEEKPREQINMNLSHLNGSRRSVRRALKNGARLRLQAARGQRGRARETDRHLQREFDKLLADLELRAGVAGRLEGAEQQYKSA
ncbi:hypothetical protein LTR85_008781 [Meristemomyces frigidus]|nr:hypothetical protein LTR85_008781 [Meristemomyces frigidus]